MSQGELSFKGMSDAELQKEALRVEAADRRKSAKKRSTKKKAGVSTKKRATKKKVGASTKKRATKKKPATTKAKQFFTVQVPVGAKLSITPPCRGSSTPKTAKNTPPKRKAKRSKNDD